MKIVTVVGARPQFIKCAPVSRELRKDHEEILVHTGQHYDPEMSDVFFNELEIPKPDYNLGAGSGLHGKQTGEILIGVETVLIREKPDLVFVYGDTNSTLGGALAATKLHIPVAHVEAGLRSFDRAMPEEINRVVTDHLSSILFCPTETAVMNLTKEGITNGVFPVGDVMADSLAFNRQIAQRNNTPFDLPGLVSKKYFVLTVHRASNTNSQQNLTSIIQAVADSDIPVVFPAHPRTRKYLQEYGLLDTMPAHIFLIDPLGYLDMIHLMAGARKILTDSGGIQKEAYMLGIPCITLRKNTEWVETLHDDWNVLVGSDKEKISSALMVPFPEQSQHDLYQSGASGKIRSILNEYEKNPALINYYHTDEGRR